MKRNGKIAIFVLAIITVIMLVLVIISASPNSDQSGLYKVLGTPVIAVQNGFKKVTDKVSRWFVYMNSYDKISDELDELKKENDELSLLKSENERLENENRELKELLNLKDYTGNYTLIAGNIIAEDVTDWFNTFTIDLGEKDGITVNSPVVSSLGLVGIVTEVGENSSKIVTIVDEENAFMCRVSRTNELVRVKGVSGESLVYQLRVDRVGASSKIVVGDTVATAASGDIYPEGIMVGTITEISKDEATGETIATVVPSVDLTKLSKVYVMKAYQEEE